MLVSQIKRAMEEQRSGSQQIISALHNRDSIDKIGKEIDQFKV